MSKVYFLEADASWPGKTRLRPFLPFQPHYAVLKQELRRHFEQICPEHELRRWFDPLCIRVDDTAAAVRIVFPHALFRSWFMSGQREIFEQHATALVSHPFVYEISVNARPGGQRTAAFPSSTQTGTPQAGEDTENIFSRQDKIDKEQEEQDAQQTFDNFLANRKNDFPLAAARELARGDAPASYIPFVVYGPSGSGKTHLLRAIAHSLKKFRSEKKFYGNGGAIISELFHAVGNGGLPTSIVLCIDDMQRISSSPALQEQAVLIMDAATARGSLVAVAMEEHPLICSDLSQKLRQRLTSGLVVELKKPDLDIRRQYVQQKNISLGLSLTKDDIFSLARAFQDFRVLDGALNKLFAYRSLVSRQNTDITHILKFTAPSKSLTPDAVLGHVAAHYAVPVEELPGTSKKKDITRARQIAVFLCRELLGLSLAQLGYIFGNRDHSSIAYTVKKIRELQKSDKDVNNTVSLLKEMCLFH